MNFLRSILILSLLTAPALAEGPQIVTLDSSSPLLEIRVMIKAGSAHDPLGKEGLASLTADALLEGGFGAAENPTTKEDLAQITSPWGGGARPGAFLDKETTTISMTVPREVLDEFIDQILTPMFTQPLFDEAEIDRLKGERETRLSSSLRYENIEFLGLESLDNYLFDGTSYAHHVAGTVRGVAALKADDARAFYAEFYRPENMILGVSTTDSEILDALSDVLAAAGKPVGKKSSLKFSSPSAPTPVDGRELTIVKMPDAGATGIHLAYPLPIDRTHPDYPALYVASVYFGTHRDGHGQLYKQIRQERGYNYGDYAYVEHFAFRPFNLFQPFNTPRKQQYFSMWIRPVGDEYAHHLLKAAVYELENLVAHGISAEDVEAAKNKARVLYLNLAETGSRLLAARLDDAWWGMSPGYLDGYLERIEAVTNEQVQAAVAKYLSADDLKILIVTDSKKADALAEDILADRNNSGKQLADYQVASREGEGETIWELPESRIKTIQRDAVWAAYPLGLSTDRVRVIPVEALFESGSFVDQSVLDGEAR